MQTLGGDALLDDSLDVFDIHQKPHQKAILENNISAYDFSCFIFGKQAHLLLAMDNAVEVMNACVPFAQGLIRRFSSQVRKWIFWV